MKGGASALPLLIILTEVHYVNQQYFYCYSPRLKERLLAEGERFICVGINESTGKKFWLFPQTERLGEVLTAWKARNS